MRFLWRSLIFLGLSSTIYAHQFFPMQTKDGLKIGFWADTHWGQYQPDRIFGIAARDENGKKIKAGFDYQNAKLFAQKDPATMVVMYDFGYYTFTKDKKHYPSRRDTITDKTGANEVTATRHIYKMGKSIFKWSKDALKPYGTKLEIIPTQNPLELKVGSKLKVQVLLDGKPANKIGFEDQNGDLEGVSTDKNGYATITLSKPKDGYQIIAAGVKLPFNLDRYGEILQLTATLSFLNK